MNAAKITGEAKSRKGTIPGNLICFQGDIISQGIDYVETFFQLDPLQERVAAALEKNSNDPWALAHRGEMALEDGKVDQAIEDVRHAFQIDASPFNRDLLVEVLTAGLTTDFQKHKGAVDDLEHLVQLDHERAVFLRVLASGLQKNGNTLAALNAFLKLGALEPQSEDPEEIDPSFAVTRSAWIRAQFRSLLSAAKPADRPAVDEAVAKQLELSLAAGNIKQLRQFLDCFGDHPAADRARQLLAQKLTGSDSLLERESLLRQAQKSTDETQRASASAALAVLLADAGQTEEAAKEFRRLQETFGAKAVLNGKNVKQLRAAYPAASPLRLPAGASETWPDGDVKAERSTFKGMHIAGINRLFPLEVRGARGPYFENMNVGYSPDTAQILGCDGLGKELFRVGLNDSNPNIGFAQPPNLAAASVMVQGHVLILSTGTQLMAIDTLKPAAGTNNRILWRKDIADAQTMNVYLQPAVAIQPWGGRRIQFRGPNQQPVGNIGPVTTDAVYYQRGRDVFAIDLLTGSTIWVRHGIEPGCDIFGDDEVLVLGSPTEPKGWAIRAADGELISECVLPKPEQRWTTFGRNVLCWTPLQDGNRLLKMIDPITQREIWTENFSSGLQGDTIDNDSVAVLQPDGKFVVLSLADGKKTISEQLDKEPNLKSIHMLRSSTQDILLTDRQDGAAGSIRGQVVNPFYNGFGGNGEARTEITGNVYAFDRTSGKPMWPGPARLNRQTLISDLPGELPVIVFTRFTQNLPNGRQPPFQGTLLCLDKRNGRVLYEDDKLAQAVSLVDASGSMEDHTVTLQIPPESVTLKFTSTPVPPEPPFQDGVFEKPLSALERTRAGSIFRAIGGMISDGPSILPQIKINVQSGGPPAAQKKAEK